MRAAAVQALAAGWYEELAPAVLLRERAVADRDPEVRATAVQALAVGWPDDEATAPWLGERAAGDPDPEVRAAAVRALAAGWLDDPAPDTVDLLRTLAVADAHLSVRQAAAQAANRP